MISHVPSVEMQTIPNDSISHSISEEVDNDPEERISVHDSDKHIVPDNEFSDSEDEGDNRRDVTSHEPTQPKRQKCDKIDSSDNSLLFQPIVEDSAEDLTSDDLKGT